MDENEYTNSGLSDGATTEESNLDSFGADFISALGLEDETQNADETTNNAVNQPNYEVETAQTEPQIEESTENTEENHQNQEDVLTAIYNGQNFNIPAKSAQEIAQSLGLDANTLISTIQKGMNYDRIATRQTEESQVLEQYAAIAGVSKSEYIKRLNDNIIQNAINSEVESLRAQYPESDEALLQQLARANVDRQTSAQELAEQQRIQRENEEKSQAQTNMWVGFLNKYGSELKITNAEDIPQEIIEGVQNGLTPTEAYLQMKNSNLQKQLTIQEQNLKNKVKSPGSLRSNAGAPVKDAFLAGLFG